MSDRVGVLCVAAAVAAAAAHQRNMMTTYLP